MTKISAEVEKFGDVFERTAEKWSPFCFGCDPAAETLRAWALPVDLSGLARFCEIVLTAAVGTVGIIKPQIAFFEAFGPGGFEQLQRLIANARAAGLIVIADIKRSDIGSSVDAYASAWLGADSPFGVHAITANAYLGLGSLTPMFERADETGTGVFVVVRSSNPEGASVQDAMIGNAPLADHLAGGITAFNEGAAGGTVVGPVGAVIGATLDAAAVKTIGLLPRSLFLVPGLGAQGATMDDIARLFGPASGRVIPTSSRGILRHGPDAAALKAALKAHVDDARRLREQSGAQR